MLSREEVKLLLLMRNRPGNVFSKPNMPKGLIMHIAGGGAFQAKLLLDYVIQADFDKIKQMAQMNPQLMFMKANSEDVTGNTISMSPLQYALYVYDTYSCHIFFNIAKKQDLVPQYAEILLNQDKYFNFTPFFNAYKTYQALFQRWYQHNATNNELDKCWRETIGGAQKFYLPRCHLKQILMKSNLFSFTHNWEKNGFFNTATPNPLTLSILYSDNNQLLTKQDFELILTKLGNSAAIGRETSNDRTMTAHCHQCTTVDIYIRPHESGILYTKGPRCEDLSIFENLIKQRKAQQAQHVKDVSALVNRSVNELANNEKPQCTIF